MSIMRIRLGLAIVLVGCAAMGGVAQAHVTKVPMRSAHHLAVGWARSFGPESYTVKCRRVHRSAECGVLVRNFLSSATDNGVPLRATLRDRIIIRLRHGHSKIVYSAWFQV